MLNTNAFFCRRNISLGFLILTIIATATWLIVLELDEPLFYTRYDGITYSLSSYAYNWRAIVENKTIPLINFHQRLGHVYFPLAHSAVLSPLPYLSMWLSKIFTNDIFYTIEIMQFIYHLIGTVGMFYLLRQLKVTPTISMLGSLMWTTYPFFISISAVWPIENHLFAYLPLNFLLLERLITTRSFKHGILLAIVNTWFFFSSYPEYTFLVLMFSAMTLVLISAPKLDRGQIKQVSSLVLPFILSIAIFLLLSSPLLLTMYEAKLASAHRAGPLPVSRLIRYPTTWKIFFGAQTYRSYPQTLWWANSYVYYVGAFNLVLLILLAVRSIRTKTKNQHTVVYSILALTAFLLSTTLRSYFAGVPLYNSFARAHKTYPFFIFFITLVVIGIVTSINKRSSNLGRQALHALLVLSITTNILFVWQNKQTFWGISAISSPLAVTKNFINPDFGRILTILPFVYPEDYQFTAFNFASLYNLNDFSGYDALVAKINYELTFGSGMNYKAVFPGLPDEHVLDYLSSWSVRYLQTRKNQTSQYYFAQNPHLKLLYQDEHILLYENTKALPYVYNPTEQEVIVPHRFGVNEVNVYPTNPQAHQLVVNIAPLPRYNVFFDNKKFGRVVSANGPIIIDVPANTENVLIKYEDPLFLLGVGLSLSTILTLVLISLIFTKIIPERRKRATGS